MAASGGIMAKKEKWLKGREKPIRALFTEEEHELIREAAHRARKSMSRFVIEAAVAAARSAVPPVSEKET